MDPGYRIGSRGIGDGVMQPDRGHPRGMHAIGNIFQLMIDTDFD